MIVLSHQSSQNLGSKSFINEEGSVGKSTFSPQTTFGVVWVHLDSQAVLAIQQRNTEDGSFCVNPHYHLVVI